MKYECNVHHEFGKQRVLTGNAARDGVAGLSSVIDGYSET
jgi:hypothetical protein